MSQSEYLELVEWMNIRGPVGPARWDHYFATIVLLLSRLAGNEKVAWEDCLPGWLKPEEASGIHFLAPWVDYDE